MKTENALLKIPWSFSLLAIILTTLFGGVSNSLAQNRDDLEWAAKQIQQESSSSREKRRDLVVKLLDRLGSSPSPGMDQRELVYYLRLQKSYLDIDPDGLSNWVKKLEEATTPEQRREALVEVRYELLQRTGNFAQVLTPNNLNGEDATQLLSALHVASQAFDDIRDPSMLGGKASGITSVLRQAKGYANFAAAIKDPNAKNVVESYKGTIGTIEGKLGRLGVSLPNPIKAFDFAFGVSAAQMQVAREGLLLSKDALVDVAAAIDGDKDAEKRLQDHASKIGNTFSPANWGRAMANSMMDSLVDRVPFVRFLAKSTMPKPTGMPFIVKFLQLIVECPGDGFARVEISQVEDKVRAVIAENVADCLPKGELLFEGDYFGDNVYIVQIFDVRNGVKERRVMNGKVVVQRSNLVRVESSLLRSPGSFYLTL